MAVHDYLLPFVLKRQFHMFVSSRRHVVPEPCLHPIDGISGSMFYSDSSALWVVHIFITPNLSNLLSELTDDRTAMHLQETPGNAPFRYIHGCGGPLSSRFSVFLFNSQDLIFVTHI